MAKPQLEIDILQMELDGDLPHWLSVEARTRDKVEAIRAKHREKRRRQQLEEES